MDLVSIIVPVYKVEQYLHECVDSILAQTYKNIEVILVDDGSPDGCPQICDEYASKDSRVRVIHKLNGGLSDARNFGLDVAKGKYVTFCDSDDKIDSQMIATLMNFAFNYKADIIGCESVMFDTENLTEIPIYHSSIEMVEHNAEKSTIRLLYGSMDSSVCNKLFRREIIGEIRFIKGRYNEDIIFLAKMFTRCSKMLQINDAFYRYRITDGSITHTFNERSLDPLRNVEDVSHIVHVAFPSCEKALFYYKSNAIKTVATGIVRNKLLKIEPYTTAFKTACSYLQANYLKILLNSDFDIRFKFAMTTLIIIKTMSKYSN